MYCLRQRHNGFIHREDGRCVKSGDDRKETRVIIDEIEELIEEASPHH
jgi:hypothetical protein